MQLDQSTPMLICAIISGVALLFPILTFLLFPDLRCLRYVELVFYVSINDLIATIGAGMGKTVNGSPACWFQGIATNWNYLSAVMWTTTIAFQLWLVVSSTKIIVNMSPFHIFCWGFPLLVALLPLSTNSYGNPDDEADWCFISSTLPGYPQWTQLFWELLSFYIWMWLCIIAMTVLLILVLFKRRSMRSVPAAVESSIWKLFWYPLIVCMCWIIPSYTDIYANVQPDAPVTLSSERLQIASSVIPILQGLLTATVFAANNAIVRSRWRRLLARLLLGCFKLFVSDTTIPSARTANPPISSSAGVGARLAKAAEAQDSLEQQNMDDSFGAYRDSTSSHGSMKLWLQGKVQSNLRKLSSWAEDWADDGVVVKMFRAEDESDYLARSSLSSLLALAMLEDPAQVRASASTSSPSPSPVGGAEVSSAMNHSASVGAGARNNNYHDDVSNGGNGNSSRGSFSSWLRSLGPQTSQMIGDSSHQGSGSLHSQAAEMVSTVSVGPGHVPVAPSSRASASTSTTSSTASAALRRDSIPQPQSTMTEPEPQPQTQPLTQPLPLPITASVPAHSSAAQQQSVSHLMSPPVLGLGSPTESIFNRHRHTPTSPSPSTSPLWSSGGSSSGMNLPENPIFNVAKKQSKK